MQRWRTLALILGVIALGGGVIRGMHYVHQRRIEDQLSAIPARILAGMTLDQKIGQLLHVGLSGPDMDPTIARQIGQAYVGGVILFARNIGTPGQLLDLTRGLESASMRASGVPLLISVDQEGGRVQRLGPELATHFPSLMAVGRTDSSSYAEEIGLVTGHELRRLGINLVLAPVLDINNNAANPVINVRSFGQTAEIVTRLGLAYNRGAAAALTGPVIKHFPGHGDTSIDSHLDLPVIHKTRSQLEELELIPFRAAIAEGAGVVMVAHLLIPDLDPKHPASLSTAIVSGLLRDQLGFNGLVMTDAIEMQAIADRYSPGQIAVQAFRPGVDILLVSGHDPRVTAEMTRALRAGFVSGQLSLEDLDESVQRQIRYKLLQGLFFEVGSHWVSSPLIADHFRKQLELADLRYRIINNRYARQRTSLNEAVSEESISSLGEIYDPRARPAGTDAVLFYRSDSLSISDGTEAQALRVQQFRQLREFFQQYRQEPEHLWLVEIEEADLPIWNRELEALETWKTAKEQESGLSFGPIVALYPGNPFLGFQVPQDGAILLSFSRTRESLLALRRRALGDRPILSFTRRYPSPTY